MTAPLIEFRPGVFARVGEVAIGSDGFAYMMNGDGRWVWQHSPPPGNYSAKAWRRERAFHCAPPELRSVPTEERTRTSPKAHGWSWRGVQQGVAK